MKITASAVSLNVDDVAASARFLTTHFGFAEQMSADGFVSLAREDAGMHVVFLRRGMELLPDDQRHDHGAAPGDDHCFQRSVAAVRVDAEDLLHPIHDHPSWSNR